MKEPTTVAEVRALHDLLRRDPQSYLEIANSWLEENPGNARAYRDRHRAWMRVGEPRRALEDLNKAIELDPEPLTFFERSIVSRYLGDYEGALTDLDRSEKMIPEEWEDLGFGLLYQADCHARLGELDKALGCCARLPADFWTPGIDGAPAGDPPAIAERVKVLAAEARGGVSTRPPSE